MTASVMPGDATDAFIGLGSNVGDRAAEIEAALREIGELAATSLVARSSLYESAPLDAEGGDYLNAAARVRTSLAPLVLLRALQAIEARHGRTRPFANAPRRLDLDLLLYGDAILATPELTLPHPRLCQRAFVLKPLAEIAPGLRIPGHGVVVEMLSALGAQRVVKFA
ncbi:MAG TPA: 2-amino-4-hydroxy-6-hydroxymethyldihydropteridine diphosphokinase [Caldimonas sp.]|nr:2-amino-4-hydroxy-6-hydroxymethyldihydropteridine diphosphokinase [Caldimonas sp.]